MNSTPEHSQPSTVVTDPVAVVAVTPPPATGLSTAPISEVGQSASSLLATKPHFREPEVLRPALSELAVLQSSSKAPGATIPPAPVPVLQRSEEDVSDDDELFGLSGSSGGGLSAELLGGVAKVLGSISARETMASLFRRATLAPAALAPLRRPVPLGPPPPPVVVGASRPVSALIAVFDRSCAVSAAPALPPPAPRRLHPVGSSVAAPVFARLAGTNALATIAATAGGTGTRPAVIGGFRLPGFADAGLIDKRASSASVTKMPAPEPLPAPLPEPASEPAPGPVITPTVERPVQASQASAPTVRSLPWDCLQAVFDFAPASELWRMAQVSRDWRAASGAAACWRSASGVQEPAFAAALPAALAALRAGAPASSPAIAALRLPLLRAATPLLRAFPWARFLSAGAYKRVWRVWSTAARCEEAVSVMDVAVLAPTGQLPVVASEIQVGCMLSQIVRTGACPNFVATRAVFLHALAPHTHFATLWGGSEGEGGGGCARPPFSAAAPGFELAPTGDAAIVDMRRQLAARVDAAAVAAVAPGCSPPSIYQYIVMELCEGGDVESALRAAEPATAAAEATGGAAADAADAAGAAAAASALAQLSFALLVARHRFSLRHHDVKLLNVFLARAPGGAAAVRYALGSGEGSTALVAPLAEWGGSIVKLADYGTAAVHSDALGSPSCAHHLTTVENSAPELLTRGAAAPQAFASADSWSLGLVAVHLLTGNAPYEELLAPLRCPLPLRRELRRLWASDAAFFILRPAISASGGATLLADTLYRILVLTAGAPPAAAGSGAEVGADALRGDGPVGALLADVAGPGKSAVGGEVIVGSSGHRLGAPALAALRRGFAEHAAEFSLWLGSAPFMRRARRRMALLPGSGPALAGLLALRPQDRPTMRELLLSSFFERLHERVGTSDEDSARAFLHASAFADMDAAALPDL